MTTVSDDEWVRALADAMGTRQVAGVAEACMGYRNEFNANSDDLAPKDRRDKLRKIESSCLRAARALTARGLQDVDWIPRGPFEMEGRTVALAVGTTQLAETLWILSRLSAREAQSMALPKAKAVPEKDLCAQYAYRLISDFCSERPSWSEGGRFVTVTAMLLEWWTGAPADDATSVVASCRKVCRQLNPPAGRRRFG